MDKTRYNRIKAELAEAGKQNKDLARYMDVHVTTISDWCTNTNQPSVQHLYKVAEFLQIDVRQLLLPTRWEFNETHINQAAEQAPAYNKKAGVTPGKTKKTSSARRQATRS